MKFGIFLLSFIAYFLPVSAKTINNSEELISAGAASNLSHFHRSYDDGNATLLAQPLTHRQPALASPDAIDTAPVVLLSGFAPKPQTFLQVAGSALPPVNVLGDPSRRSRPGIIDAMVQAARAFDTRRTFSGESPLAAVLDLLAGLSLMAGIGHYARYVAPALGRRPRAKSTEFQQVAAEAPGDVPMAGFVATGAMIPVGGYAMAGFEKPSFEWSRDRSARSRPSGREQGSFGQADYREIGCGDRDVMVPFHPAALGEWPAGSTETAVSAPAERSPIKAAVEEYRIFVLEDGIVRYCQQFSAAGDGAALAQARFCEPTKAFELWRGHLLVTRQPSIQ